MSFLENTSPDKWTAGAGPIDTVYQVVKDLNNPRTGRWTVSRSVWRASDSSPIRPVPWRARRWVS